jgi:homoserine kinase
MVCRNEIPHGRGMGSSAAAVVAGIVAARALIADPDALDDDAALALATEFEGHPDNAAPALVGGATVAWEGREGPRAARLEVHPDVEPWVFVPTVRLATKKARGVLPTHVPHADAAFNAGRSALLVEALTRRPDLLFEATEDKLHQDYRADVMASSTELVRGLRGLGLPAVVSGAGPTVLVLGRASEGDRVARAVAELLGGSDSFDVLTPGLDLVGARSERL